MDRSSPYLEELAKCFNLIGSRLAVALYEGVGQGNTRFDTSISTHDALHEGQAHVLHDVGKARLENLVQFDSDVVVCHGINSRVDHLEETAFSGNRVEDGVQHRPAKGEARGLDAIPVDKAKTVRNIADGEELQQMEFPCVHVPSSRINSLILSVGTQSCNVMTYLGWLDQLGWQKLKPQMLITSFERLGLTLRKSEGRHGGGGDGGETQVSEWSKFRLDNGACS